MSKYIAVILAAGVGNRTGFNRPKQLVKLAGRPVIAHTLERFQTHSDIDEIIVVTGPQSQAEIEAVVSQYDVTKVSRVLLGGAERYQSSLAAIQACAQQAQEEQLYLLFHDAVRPLVSHAIISNVINALQHYQAVDAAIVSPDTIIETDPETLTIHHIPERQRMKLGQTPQGFKYETIRDAYELALKDPQFVTTDDCSAVITYLPETRVRTVEGSLSNMKLTYAEDLSTLDKLIQVGAGKKLEAEAENLRFSQLEDKVVAIVGGTSGIGKALAELIDAYGGRVYAASRREQVDVTDPVQVKSFFEDVVQKEGRLDAVINCAAVLNRQPLNNMSLEQISADIDVNLKGAIYLAKLAYPYLKESHGHFLVFTSSSYTYGRAYYSTYSASKAGIVNLTQALADEWANAGIHVNCINPARTATAMRTQAFGVEPPNTLLEPAEVARRALRVLISDATGQIYDIQLPS